MSASSYEKLWFSELMTTGYEYSEPILEDSTAEVVKYICDFLKEDIHVFILSIEVLEEYIKQKNDVACRIEDPLLTVGCVVLLCSKFAGEQSDIQIKCIQDCYENISKKLYPVSLIKHVERDIFQTINGKLPLSTKVDDLNTFIEIYTKRLKLKLDVRPLCLRIMEAVHISRIKLHTRIKSVYMQNQQAFLAFKELLCNKLFFPSGILLCAFRLTNYKNVIDLEEIMTDLSCTASVHKDHIQFLSDTLYDLIIHM